MFPFSQKRIYYYGISLGSAEVGGTWPSASRRRAEKTASTSRASPSKTRLPNL
jgi:hypothetical protein